MASKVLILTAKILARITCSQLKDPAGRFYAEDKNVADDHNRQWAKKKGDDGVKMSIELMDAEFKAIAHVLDRFFLILFFVVTVVATASVLGSHT
jgi:hypothetical protein